MYYHSGSSRRLGNDREKLFQTQISSLEKENRGLSTLSEELMDEIEVIQDSIQMIKNQKQKIEIVYVEKYKKIRKFNNRDIVNELKAIFPDSIR